MGHGRYSTEHTHGPVRHQERICTRFVSATSFLYGISVATGDAEGTLLLMEAEGWQQDSQRRIREKENLRRSYKDLEEEDRLGN